jgi:excisionase family DNA binding protein
VSREEFVDMDTVCAFVKVPKGTVYRWSHEKYTNGFPCYRIGKHLRFRLSEVIFWVERYGGSPGAREMNPR